MNKQINVNQANYLWINILYIVKTLKYVAEENNIPILWLVAIPGMEVE